MPPMMPAATAEIPPRLGSGLVVLVDPSEGRGFSRFNSAEADAAGMLVGDASPDRAAGSLGLVSDELSGSDMVKPAPSTMVASPAVALGSSSSDGSATASTSGRRASSGCATVLSEAMADASRSIVTGSLRDFECRTLGVFTIRFSVGCRAIPSLGSSATIPSIRKRGPACDAADDMSRNSESMEAPVGSAATRVFCSQSDRIAATRLDMHSKSVREDTPGRVADRTRRSRDVAASAE